MLAVVADKAVLVVIAGEWHSWGVREIALLPEDRTIGKAR
jgi:hypothetical protein